MNAVKELYDMNNVITDLQAKYDEGIISEDTLNDTVSSVIFDAKDNMQSLANWYRKLDDNIDARKKAIKQLQEDKKSMESTQNFIKTLANEVLEKMGVDKTFTAGLSTFKTRTTKQIVIGDNAVIPSSYYVQQDPKLDKMKLNKDVRAGKQIVGVTIEPKRSITIK